MKIIVNHEELRFVEKELLECSNLFEQELKNLLLILNNLNDAWDGEDSDKFIIKTSSYIEGLSQIPTSLRSFSSFIGNANSKYESFDDELKRDIERAENKEYDGQ